MKIFKYISLCMIWLLTGVVMSCTDDNSTPDIETKTIMLNIIGVADVASDDLLGVQVYRVTDRGVSPYASGLFSGVSSILFEGEVNATYRVVATVVMDGKLRIELSGGGYGRPFETVLNEELNREGQELTYLKNSTATLAESGTMSSLPNLLRYYGEAQVGVTANSPIIDVDMKCVSFGAKISGVDSSEQVTLALSGAPKVDIRADEVMYYTFNYITNAYSADEDSAPYSENINTEIIRSGASVHSENITYKRGYSATITISKNGADVGFDFETPFEDGITTPPSGDYSAYITKVLDFIPAPGQFTNKYPTYEEGDTQQDMNDKVLSSIGNNNLSMISLGGYGGYVVVGFDHTIENKSGLRDFRVLGNAYYSLKSLAEGDAYGGSCEAGIIMVAYDANNNGTPDDDEWYEIAGSAHADVTQEAFYAHALSAGNDVNFYRSDFELTYLKPESEPTATSEYATYISWNDNKGNTGYIPKNGFNRQAYFPQWVADESLTFKGSRLPHNAVNENNTYVLYRFGYGYADNEYNTNDDSAIDISWAVDSNGNSVHLPGVDFIKIYNGVNQVNGWIGESSTEVTGVEDLHILGVEIATR